MKASEVIQAALDNHYRTERYSQLKHEFMCHAIEEYIQTKRGIDIFKAMNEVGEVTRYFMPLFEEYNTGVLTNYLKYTNKRYAYYVVRFGQFTPFCVKVRVKFWRDLIADLKEKGL